MSPRKPAFPLAIMLLAIALLSRVPSAAASAEEALKTFKAFLQARENADGIEQLYQYFPSGQIEQLKELPPETLTAVGDSVLNPSNADQLRRPDGGFELISSMGDANEVRLTLQAQNINDAVRTDLRRTVTMLKEDDGWKIEDPTPRSWRVTGRMPIDAPAKTGTSELGSPAGIRQARFTGSIDELSLAAEFSVLKNDSNIEDLLRWDPRGNLLGAGSRVSGMTFLSLPDLELRWKSHADYAGNTSGSISHDGTKQLSSGGPGRRPMILPLTLNVERKPAADEYFFVEPAYTAISDDAGKALIRDATFHPREPVLAAVNEGAEGNAIYFQQVDDLIGDIKVKEQLSAWSVEELPTNLTWSVAGDRLAWVRGFMEIGSEIEIRDYPSGDGVQTISSDAHNPGTLAFSPDGKHLLSLGGDDEGSVALVWNIERGEIVGTYPGVRYGAWAPGGEFVFLVSTGGMVIEEGLDNVIQVARVGESDPVATFSAFPKGEDMYAPRILGVSTSPNGRYLAAIARTTPGTGGDTIKIKLWEVERK